MTAVSRNAGLTAVATATLGILLGSTAALVPTPDSAARSAEPTSGLAAFCTPEAVQALAPAGVTVKPIGNGPFKTATKLFPANGAAGEFCQVTGSFVTNPATRKTANFLASFPAAWNGKYLQLGCSGHCGQFFVSNVALPPHTVTTQGHPGQIIEKGYATFATDQGHEGMDPAAWAIKPDGSISQDHIDDFLIRADQVLVRIGKQFSTAFYARMKGAPQNLSRSYFQGCSGGGRDAMVAASYFPQEFDGIIAGSPYDSLGMTIQASAIGAAAARPGGNLTPALFKLFDTTVKAQCDSLDGVSDGLIQNPAACNFRAERDLPRCSAGAPAGQCFSDAQVETASVIASAVTDERGNVVQPGYSISEFEVQAPEMAALTNGTLKVFVHRNDPAFKPASLFSFTRGGTGPVNDFRAVVPSEEVARVKAAMRLGSGHLPENMATLIKSKTKLLMWHNYSDGQLTPYSSTNWYARLAARNGGYAKVQRQARLFMLPGTTHCSITGIAPNSFDAIGALENWVERGQAPNSLLATVAARQFTPGAPKSPNLSTPGATMPLCAFPAMARYRGAGDPKDGANWSCQASDKRLLTLGETGRQAGVLK